MFELSVVMAQPMDFCALTHSKVYTDCTGKYEKVEAIRTFVADGAVLVLAAVAGDNTTGGCGPYSEKC